MGGPKTVQSHRSIHCGSSTRGFRPHGRADHLSSSKTGAFRLIFSAWTCLFALDASADASYAKILSPTDGAVLSGISRHTLTYEINPGAKGNHVHVVIDGREVGILRKRTGTYRLEGLAAGANEICLKVVNKAHAPIGVEHCIRVVVEK